MTSFIGPNDLIKPIEYITQGNPFFMGSVSKNYLARTHKIYIQWLGLILDIRLDPFKICKYLSHRREASPRVYLDQLKWPNPSVKPIVRTRNKASTQASPTFKRFFPQMAKNSRPRTTIRMTSISTETMLKREPPNNSNPRINNIECQSSNHNRACTTVNLCLSLYISSLVC